MRICVNQETSHSPPSALPEPRKCRGLLHPRRDPQFVDVLDELKVHAPRGLAHPIGVAGDRRERRAAQEHHLDVVREAAAPRSTSRPRRRTTQFAT
jgi:hypothetical protein